MNGIDSVITVLDQLRQVDDPEVSTMIINRWRRSKGPKPRATMPTYNFGSRKSLTELRPRMLAMVEEYGFGPDYDRDELRHYFSNNWYRLFGPLRKSKALEVPSDQLRKGLMISQLLDLIETRRAEYADERSNH
jgi:hypothetical protein